MKLREIFFGPFVFLVVFGIFLLCHQTEAGQLDETRFCGPPSRDANGRIIRSSIVITAFKKIHPCPSTGLSTGACPGWAVDHILPLKCGGCDSVSNMAYMPLVLKSGPGTLPKDRWEIKIYCRPMLLVPMPEKPLLLSVGP